MSVHAWGEKMDAASGIAMIQEVEDDISKWLQSLQLRDFVPYFNIGIVEQQETKSFENC